MEEVHTRLEEYAPNEVAVVLWGLARCRGRPDPAFAAACLRHCFVYARQLSPTALSMLLWFVGSWTQGPPPATWVNRLLVATQVRREGW